MVCWGSWGCSELDTAERLNLTGLNCIHTLCHVTLYGKSSHFAEKIYSSGFDLTTCFRYWDHSRHNVKSSLLLLLSLQSCLTLFNPTDGNPPGSPIPEILQARTLEWVAISFSNVWKWKVKVKPLSRVQSLATPSTAAHLAPPSMGFSRQEYWSGVPLPFLKSSLRSTLIVSLFSFLPFAIVIYHIYARLGKDEELVEKSQSSWTSYPKPPVRNEWLLSLERENTR